MCVRLEPSQEDSAQTPRFHARGQGSVRVSIRGSRGGLDESLKPAASLGAQILRPKSAVPKMGWFAMVADPEMNVFGIWQDDPDAE